MDQYVLSELDASGIRNIWGVAFLLVLLEKLDGCGGGGGNLSLLVRPSHK